MRFSVRDDFKRHALPPARHVGGPTSLPSGEVDLPKRRYYDSLEHTEEGSREVIRRRFSRVRSSGSASLHEGHACLDPHVNAYDTTIQLPKEQDTEFIYCPRNPDSGSDDANSLKDAHPTRPDCTSIKATEEADIDAKDADAQIQATQNRSEDEPDSETKSLVPDMYGDYFGILQNLEGQNDKSDDGSHTLPNQQIKKADGGIQALPEEADESSHEGEYRPKYDFQVNAKSMVTAPPDTLAQENGNLHSNYSEGRYLNSDHSRKPLQGVEDEHIVISKTDPTRNLVCCECEMPSIILAGLSWHDTEAQIPITELEMDENLESHDLQSSSSSHDNDTVLSCGDGLHMCPAAGAIETMTPDQFDWWGRSVGCEKFIKQETQGLKCSVAPASFNGEDIGMHELPETKLSGNHLIEKATMEKSPPNELQDDIMIVCDAGGGTVDLVTYSVTGKPESIMHGTEVDPMSKRLATHNSRKHPTPARALVSDSSTWDRSMKKADFFETSFTGISYRTSSETAMVRPNERLPAPSLVRQVIQQVNWAAGQSQTSAPGRYRAFEIPSFLDKKHPVNALGDYCAKRNFMKEAYANKLRLDIDRSQSSEVTIGSGKKVVTTGVAKTSFRFKDEAEEYTLIFHILPSCIHNVILGKGFLKATNTFSNLANKARRIKERILDGITHRHLLYLGDSAPRFGGLINGAPEEALADSGAKVLVMDEDYAMSIGLSVEKGRKHRTRLKFADNSTAYTSGTTYGVEWEFGHGGGASDRFLLDFHVLKNAPANVILSDEFLFGTDAFIEYECFLVDEDDEDDDAFFFAIDVDANHPTQVRLNMSSIANMQHAEMVLRGEKEDYIADLPTHMRQDAWRQETERRSQWERDFVALRLYLSSIQATATNSTLCSPGMTPPLKRSRWWYKFKRTGTS